MSKYRIKKGLISEKLSSKITIFDGDKSVLYTLNDSASFIFQKIKNGHDKKKIIDALAKHYDIRHEKAEKDVNELINDLIVRKIIVLIK